MKKQAKFINPEEIEHYMFYSAPDPKEKEPVFVDIYNSILMISPVTYSKDIYLYIMHSVSSEDIHLDWYIKTWLPINALINEIVNENEQKHSPKYWPEDLNTYSALKFERDLINRLQGITTSCFYPMDMEIFFKFFNKNGGESIYINHLGSLISS